jgi:hypothetical protein
MNRSTLRIVIIVLTLITAGIHLWIAISQLASGNTTALTIPFIGNGTIYLLLLLALFANVPYFSTHRDVAHYLMMAFAAVTFIAFFVANGSHLSESLGPLSITAKVDELLLIIATFMHLRAA